MQQDLVYAENGNLSVNPEEIRINTIISSVYNLYADHNISIGKNLIKQYLAIDHFIITDPTLLIRSLGNLVKNALEAIRKGETVCISAEMNDRSVLFKINNDRIISPNIQLHIFQRSFSTKANSGRGIGTYSVKLIVEQYLNGKVRFISNDKEQTTFIIEVPKTLC